MQASAGVAVVTRKGSESRCGENGRTDFEREVKRADDGPERPGSSEVLKCRKKPQKCTADSGGGRCVVPREGKNKSVSEGRGNWCRSREADKPSDVIRGGDGCSTRKEAVRRGGLL